MAKAKRKTGASKRHTADPCWKGYEQVGSKKKGSRSVPNCVPKKSK